MLGSYEKQSGAAHSRSTHNSTTSETKYSDKDWTRSSTLKSLLSRLYSFAIHLNPSSQSHAGERHPVSGADKMLTAEIRIKAELRAWPLAVLTKRLHLSLSAVYKGYTGLHFLFPNKSLTGVKGGRIKQYSQRMGVSVCVFVCVRVCVCMCIHVCTYVRVCLLFVCLVFEGGSYSTWRCDVLCLLSLAAPSCIFTAACVCTCLSLLGVHALVFECVWVVL